MQHKPGDKLFIPSSFYMSRGSSDFCGGLATIDRFSDNKGIMLVFKERPDTSYNYQYILENQEEWSKEYAGKIAHKCPDVDKPWIENGDIVNGNVWEGGDIW